MKVITKHIKKSFDASIDNRNDIILYDKDNKYPQNIMLVCKRSGAATACINLLSDFIFGAGFADYGDKVIGGGVREVKLDDALNYIAKDYSMFRGFALHINYNANYKIHSIKPIPFEYCRLGKPDSKEYVGKIAYYSGWDEKHIYTTTRRDIGYYDIFNPKKEIIDYQVKQAGGWDNYKGQILWFSLDGAYNYPTALFDPVIEDVETDAGIKTFKYKNVNNRFSASHIFIHKGEFESEDDQQEFVDNLNKFQGAENAGSIFLVTVDMDEQIPEVTELKQSVNLDKLYEYTEKSIQDNIRKQAKVPPVLIGDLVAGRLGTAEEIRDATILFNAFTSPHRKLMETTFHDLMKIHRDPISEKLEIKKLSIIDEEELARRDTGGVK